VAYDAELADRIREELADQDALTERRCSGVSPSSFEGTWP
jgi:hypothetical protein